MTDPVVTVAMSVFNSAATVKVAINSILTQTFEKWELIVVDDGSTDQTPNILARMQDPRIRVVREPAGNLGLASRLNQCVRLARGHYVARMDADDIAYPRRLERQVRFLESHPDVDLVGAGAVVFKKSGEVVGCYPIARTHEEICRRPWWGFPLAHPTWMGKHSWFSRHCYAEYLTKGQDQELLLRSYQTSQFAALEEVLLGYRMERISAWKLGKGRLNYCGQLWKQAADIPSLLTAARGTLIHGLAFGRDMLLDLTGTLGRGARQSFQTADDQVRSEWREVWCRSQ